MLDQDTIMLLATLAFLVAAAAIITVETRPFWAAKELVYEGNLTGYTTFEDYHVLTFENDTITLDGWLWKTHPPLNDYVKVYTRANTIVIEEYSPPTIA
jgi:hypothetical protein